MLERENFCFYLIMGFLYKKVLLKKVFFISDLLPFLNTCTLFRYQEKKIVIKKSMTHILISKKDINFRIVFVI